MKKILLFILFFAQIGPIFAYNTKAKSALLIDYDSGQELFSKNPDELMTPSSMLKLMTLTVLFDKIKQGEINMNDKMLVSKNAHYENKKWIDASKICLKDGQKITVKDAILGLIVLSAGDAGVVVAEHIAGSEEEYLKLMEKKAREINMPYSSFGNVTGLPNPDNLMTSRELITLADYIITEHSDIYPLFSTRVYEFDKYKTNWCEIWGQNHKINYNKLLFIMGGADGLKTGHTKKGGYGMVASAIVRGRRLIGVLNGLNVSGHDILAREMKKLLDYGFETTKNKIFYKKTDIITEFPVWYGKKRKVKVGTVKNFVLTQALNSKPDNLRIIARYDSPITAPIKKGDKLGVILIEQNGKVLQKSELVAKEDIGKVKFLGKIFSNIIYLIQRII